jgi:hypothetical protein
MAARITLSTRPPGTLPRPPLAPDRTPYEQPIHLFASAVVQSGGEAGLRAEALSNLTGQPIEIHEIRFNTQVTAPLDNSVQSDPGIFTEVNLDLDGKPITNGYVPIWLMGRNDAYSQSLIVATNSGTTAVFSTTTLRLAQPMQMKPGARINAHIRHRGTVTLDATVDVGLAGKVIAGLKPSTRIPYITAFSGSPSDFDQAFTEITPEAALQNMTKKVVHVDRMLGRVALSFVSSTGIISVWDGAAGAHYSRLQRIKLAHSANRPLVRDFLPFGAVFPLMAGNSMEIPFDLAPKEYLVATFDKRPAGTTAGTFYNGTYKTQPQVSLIGWREE